MQIRKTLIIGLLAFASACGRQGEKKSSGSLVIVGGALSKENSQVFKTFIDLAGGSQSAVIGIIPAASEKPVTYASKFVGSMVEHGVSPKRVFIIPIALRNDSSTPDNETEWYKNAYHPEIVDQINSCTGIWFIGGDQTRIVECMTDKDGNETPALRAVRQVYDKGGVIGGTSAGAAVMSGIMIAAGSSFEALAFGTTNTYENIGHQEEGPLHLTRGLGFFNGAIVDQHFDRKARIGRLVIATFSNREKGLLGFGIDENTALVVTSKGEHLKVIGSGGVTIVDAKNSTGGKVADGRKWYRGIEVSFLEAEDEFMLPAREVAPNPRKVLTNGNEYFNISNSYSNGSMSPNGLFKQQLTYLLADNASLNEVKSHTFSQDGKGFEVVLRKTPKTKGYWGYLGDEVDRYTVVSAEMDILPVNVRIEKVK